MTWFRENMKAYLEKSDNIHEIAVIVYTKYDIEHYLGNIELTDDEWEEIAGRFNELDWIYCTEEIMEIANDLIRRRIEECEE